MVWNIPWVSCADLLALSSPNLLHTPSPWRSGVRSREGPDTVSPDQQEWKHPCFSDTVSSTNTILSPCPLMWRKFNPVPAKSSSAACTLNTGVMKDGSTVCLELFIAVVWNTLALWGITVKWGTRPGDVCAAWEDSAAGCCGSCYYQSGLFQDRLWTRDGCVVRVELVESLVVR